MKKKTSKKLINLSVLVLCLALIMFGVYSVSKRATLNINGTVGLIVHDCSVSISATIKGDAVLTSVDENTGETVYTMHPDGKESPERTLFETVYLKEEESEKLIELKDPYYFTDLTADGYPKDILIKFTVTNLSTFTITATLNQPVLNEDIAEGGEASEKIALVAKTSHNNPALASEGYTRIKLAPNESGDMYVVYSLESAIVNGQIDYLTLQNLIDYETTIECRKFNPVKFENGEPTLELGEFTRDGVTLPVEWTAIYYQDSLYGEKHQIPAGGLNELDGKYITFAMKNVYEYMKFTNAGFGCSFEEAVFHPNSIIHKYLEGTTMAESDFMQNYSIDDQDIAYYQIQKN